MAEHWIATPADDYPDIIRTIDALDVNTLFARSVLTRDADGAVYQNRSGSPDAWYIAHAYGMTLLLGNSADEAFGEALIDHFKRLRKDEWLQARPDSWYGALRELAAQGLVKEFGRVNFAFDEAAFRANAPQAKYAVSRTPVSLIASLEGKVVPKYFWRPERHDRCDAYTCYVGGAPASTAFAAYLHGDTLELGIETHADYRGMGCAEAACRALIGDCLARGYTPDWSCLEQNTGSMALARKLGFVPIRRFPYFQILARGGR